MPEKREARKPLGYLEEESMINRFKAVCANKGKSMSFYLREFVHKFVKENEG